MYRMTVLEMTEHRMTNVGTNVHICNVIRHRMPPRKENLIAENTHHRKLLNIEIESEQIIDRMSQSRQF
jgi:hypothetical protein